MSNQHQFMTIGSRPEEYAVPQVFQAAHPPLQQQQQPPQLPRSSSMMSSYPPPPPPPNGIYYPPPPPPQQQMQYSNGAHDQNAYYAYTASLQGQHQDHPSAFPISGPSAQAYPDVNPEYVHREAHDEDDEQAEESDGNAHDASQPNPKSADTTKDRGACARCKGLKVKCVKPPYGEPCKRCLKAGADCIVLGRKKRRNPPKRELLQAQITKQAAEIQSLLAQLEAVHNAARANNGTSEGMLQSPSSLVEATSSDSGQSQLSPRDLPDSPAHHRRASGPTSPNTELDEWISKARESIREFPSFVGAGTTKELLVAQDLEDSASDSNDGYSFILEREHDHDLEHHSPRDNHKSKLAMLPTEAAPFGLMAEMSLKRARRLSAGTDEGAGVHVGVANMDFFTGAESQRSHSPGAHHQAPQILLQEIINKDDAEELFKIYFDNMNLSVSLLDPVLYDAAKTCARSAFLFTVICAIASKYWGSKSSAMYPQLMRFAQAEAGNALIRGDKTVETCHAYILLSLYPMPAKRFEDDRGWIFIGMAIRVAMDLNLQHPLTAKEKNEQHAREMLNRTRAWINCFNLDISFASQYGKAPTISSADYVANHSEDWWKRSQYNLEHFDIHLCCYNSILRQLSQFRDRIYSDPTHPTGLNKKIDLVQIAADLDDQIQNSRKYWLAILEQTDQTNSQNRFRTSLLRLNMSYQRLLALSFGFQHALGKGSKDNEEDFLRRCLRAATEVVDVVVKNVGYPGHENYLRHGPPAQCVFMTFACAFLIKLLEPKYAIKFPAVLTRGKRLEIRGLVEQVIDLLGSPKIAIDERHHPYLYSKFLQGLLNTPSARVGSMSPIAMEDLQNMPDAGNTWNTPPAQASASFVQTMQQQHHGLPSPPITAQIPMSGGVSANASFNPQAALFAGFGQMSPYQPDMFMTDTIMHTPLPFDGELLQSMQTLIQDPSIFGQDSTATLLPGFNWIRGNQGSFYNSSPSPDMFDQFTTRKK